MTEKNLTVRQKDSDFNPNSILLAFLLRMRLISFLAVLSSLAGSLLMFAIGTVNTYRSVAIFLGLEVLEFPVDIEPSEGAALRLLESLDNFLVGLTFLFFSYGIYSLCIQLGKYQESVPKWLQVKSISVLKETLLEVLVALLSVVYVKDLLEKGDELTLQWPVLIVPLSIIALALSIRLMKEEVNKRE